MVAQLRPDKCAMCAGDAHSLVHSFESRPAAEPDYGLPGYRRELWCCDNCGHFVNRHAMSMEGLYEGEYRKTAYDGDRIRQRFEKIMALPPERSDNRQRVKRILDYVRDRGDLQTGRVLDVGSGMAVFPAAMREAGWDCTAVDPDPDNAEHARQVAGVCAFAGDFMLVDPGAGYDLITFNKVLEHVDDPVAMLARAAAMLKPGGYVYVELPDGEAALAAGPEREEFFVDHLCAFSLASYALLAHKAGYRADLVERVVEPSEKYSLYGFLQAGR